MSQTIHSAISSSFGAFSPFSDKRARIHFLGCDSEDYRLYSVPENIAVERAERFARRCGVRGDIFMPRVTSFNGKIEGQGSFRRHGGSRIWNSVLADGIVLGPGQSAVFATGDCPTVVMRVSGKPITVAAHAGRDSIIPNHIIRRSHSRYGAIFNMAECFSDSERRLVEVAVVLGIDGKHFDHHPDIPGDSLMSQKNASMIEYVEKRFGKRCFIDRDTGRLSLLEVIAAQCEEMGIPRTNIRHDGIDVFSARLESGFHAFHSNRRYTEEAKATGRPKETLRNILLVEAM